MLPSGIATLVSRVNLNCNGIVVSFIIGIAIKAVLHNGH